MAVSPTPPLISVLPPAPLPTDAEAVFDAKAGVRLTAEEVMVTEQNAALAWQAGSMADTKDYKDAAATSAGNAANSATLAGQQVSLAADQVALATTQAGNAASAASSAQASAAAAGAAAGQPSLVGHGGQALCAKNDETGVEFKALGQAIGDVLETTRTPDATYLLPDTIYTRAAYPELFAIVGTQGAYNDGAAWASVNTNMASPTGTPTAIVCGKDGVVILVSGTGKAAKSLDGGATWADLTASNGPALINAQYLDTDGNGVWIATNSSNLQYVRSTDNGVTWSFATLTGITGAGGGIATDKQGNWLVVTNTANNAAKSSNNGATWSPITTAANGSPPGQCTDLVCDGTNWIVSMVSNNVPWIARTFSGQFYRAMSVGADSAVITWLAAASGVIGYSQPSIGMLLSFDGGYTWKTFPNLVAASICLAPSGTILVTTNTTTDSSLWRTTDNGETWTRAFLSASAGLVRVFPRGADSSGNVIGASASPSTVIRSTRQFNYDVATQFKTPVRKAPKGYKSYIKGKLA